jgi:hypothetical protein
MAKGTVKWSLVARTELLTVAALQRDTYDIRARRLLGLLVGLPPSDSYNILCARTPLILEELVFNLQ